MARIFEEASVQYDDWAGTAALDDPDAESLLYEMAGISRDEWWICGIEVYGSYDLTGARVYAVSRDVADSYDAMADVAQKNDDTIPVRVFEVDAEADDAALKFLTAFKRWHIAATLKHQVRDRGFRLRVED